MEAHPSRPGRGATVPNDITQLMCFTFALVMFAVSWLRHQAIRRFMKDIGRFVFWRHHAHLALTILLCGIIAVVPYMTEAWSPPGLLGVIAGMSCLMVVYDLFGGALFACKLDERPSNKFSPTTSGNQILLHGNVNVEVPPPVEMGVPL